jgi:hypothetical protein
MNWAVLNEQNQIVTIVTAPRGKLPPGCRFVREDEIPADARRAPEPTPDPESPEAQKARLAALEEKISQLEALLGRLGVKP